MKASKKEVLEFLKRFGTRVDNTPDEDVDLWMDNHICIMYNGVLYYVMESNMMYSEWERDLVEKLYDNYRY